MIVKHDIRGMQAHANLTLISSGKNALAKRIPNPNPIKEQAKTPFTGLTTDMRGRDAQGYAVCKSFNEKLPKNDIMSSRLANPNPKFEQYPQPKKRVFNSSLNIKPSEIDMLSKLKNDNAKMLIMQLLKAKSVGIDGIQGGTPSQKARLQTAYNTLCAKYESEYRKNSGTTFVLAEYVNEFKKEVRNIFGVSYDELNRPANTDAILEDILTAIKENNTTLESVLQPPRTTTEMADSSPSRAGTTTDLVPDDEAIEYDERRIRVAHEIAKTINMMEKRLLRMNNGHILDAQKQLVHSLRETIGDIRNLSQEEKKQFRSFTTGSEWTDYFETKGAKMDNDVLHEVLAEAEGLLQNMTSMRYDPRSLDENVQDFDYEQKDNPIYMMLLILPTGNGSLPI